MEIGNNPIINQLIKDSLDRKNKIEIDVTQSTANSLKKTRLGIFQNEIDYRFLLNKFKPLKTENRSAVDLLGFMGDSFNLVEFKLYDETKRRSYHHWSALFHLIKDIEKLEHASTFESKYLVNYYFVFAVRNSEKKLNNNQIDTAIEYIYIEGKKKRVLEFNLYTTLRTVERMQKQYFSNWKIELLNRKNDSFLVGMLKAQGT